MIFQRLNGGDAEKVFAIFYNVQGASITANYVARLDTGTPDGVRVTQPTTATLGLLIGVAAQTVADSTYGLFQIYGYRASAFITNDTSVAGTAGDVLIAVNGANHLKSSTATAANANFQGSIMALEAFATATTPAAAAKKVFIRAM